MAAHGKVGIGFLFESCKQSKAGRIGVGLEPNAIFLGKKIFHLLLEQLQLHNCLLEFFGGNIFFSPLKKQIEQACEQNSQEGNGNHDF